MESGLAFCYFIRYFLFMTLLLLIEYPGDLFPINTNRNDQSEIFWYIFDPYHIPTITPKMTDLFHFIIPINELMGITPAFFFNLSSTPNRYFLWLTRILPIGEACHDWGYR